MFLIFYVEPRIVCFPFINFFTGLKKIFLELLMIPFQTPPAVLIFTSTPEIRYHSFSSINFHFFKKYLVLNILFS